MKAVKLLHNAITLRRRLLDDKLRFEAAFFETVRTLLSRMTGKGKVSKKEINERIGELLKQSVKSQGVINLFSDVKAEFFTVRCCPFGRNIQNEREKILPLSCISAC